jgi:dihydrofolate reductase
VTPRLTLIAALADNRVIGADNRLIWRLKSDLKRFRALTMGKPLLMGRKTFESIGVALPGRHTVVLTRDAGFSAPGIHVAHSLEAGLARAAELAQQHGATEIMIGGGADIYAQALPLADAMHLTLVHANPSGDAFFPPFSISEWRETRRESHPAGPDDEHPFTFLDLQRRS